MSNKFDVMSTATYDKVIEELRIYEKCISEAEYTAKRLIDSNENKLESFLLSEDYKYIMECKESLKNIIECICQLESILVDTQIIPSEYVYSINNRMSAAIASLVNSRNGIHDSNLKYLTSGRARDSIIIGSYYSKPNDSIECAIQLADCVRDKFLSDACYEIEPSVSHFIDGSSVLGGVASKPDDATYSNGEGAKEDIQNEVVQMESDFSECSSLSSVTIPESVSDMKGSEWYVKAAESGSAEAMHNLGKLYESSESALTGTNNGVKVKAVKINKVAFSVITDEKVRPGNKASVDVFMYTKSQRHLVDKALQNTSEKKTEATRSMTQTSVKHGSAVTVVLTSDDAAIEDAYETMIWNGNALDFKFRFTVPETYKGKSVDFACNILFNGIHITRLYFSVKLNNAKSVPVRFVRKDCRKAFVSYSHKDKQKVVDKIIAIQEVAPRIRFWMDNQSITAGEVWRKEIASAIKASDVFLLFWSSHAKSSSEVEKEWRYALELEKAKSRRRNGSRFITPVPLEMPSECPPPDELANLHFGDPSFDADVEGIENVRFISKNSKPRNIRRIS